MSNEERMTKQIEFIDAGTGQLTEVPESSEATLQTQAEPARAEHWSDRQIAAYIERLNISADAKVQLGKLAMVTTDVCRKALRVGRRIVECVLTLFRRFPGISLGVILSLVVTALLSSIPVLGSVLGPIVGPLVLALGGALGTYVDLRNPELSARVDALVEELRPMMA
jgi:hypothetical protein